MNLSFGRISAFCPFLGLAAVAALAVPGCGAGAATVTGQVKFNGQPLPSGAISFVEQGGDKSVNVPILDGKYTATNVPTGPKRITVRTTPPPAVVAPGTTAPAYVPIPAKYGDPDQSGLTYDVKGGEQTHDVDLTTGP